VKTTGKVLLAAGVAAAATVVRRRRRTTPAEPDGWLAVTVNRSPDEVGASLPEPLTRLGAEVRVRPATGDKGTELMAKPSATVSRPDLRIALRQAKSLLETGEVIEPSAPPTTHPGPMGKVLHLVTNRAAGGGRL
jgi:hypothetical protein